ncbi:hypothetical protein Q1695_000311 [Nippostrongylus brasiliensis]|nr:hypothetical protein Q1695_000311 [Nippostrongylus brasiliensis]
MPIFKIPLCELNLKAVLLNGQSFRWRSFEDYYYGVIEGHLLSLKRTGGETITWSCLGRAATADSFDVARKLHDYFQLDVSLDKLWTDWCTKDSFMSDLREIKELQGIRILKQDPLETLMAFICSANNNIPRISSMVNKLAKLYGDPIVIDPTTSAKDVLDRFPELGYAFPTLNQLIAVQSELNAVLREQMFGYRAASVAETVRQLGQLSPTCFDDVQQLSCDEIRKFLLSFTGVGPKVAECVALMSLGQHQCVPIDRHVFEITKKYFMPSLKDSNLTVVLSRRLMKFYEEKFGAYAGWAQAVLFNQQLEKFIHTTVISENNGVKVKQKKSEVKNGKVVKKSSTKLNSKKKINKTVLND